MKSHLIGYQSRAFDKSERDNKLQEILKAGQFYEHEDPIVASIHQNRYFLVTRHLLGRCAMSDEENLQYDEDKLYAYFGDYVECGTFQKIDKDGYYQPSENFLERCVVWNPEGAPCYVVFKEPSRTMMFNKLLNRGIKLENAAAVNSQAAKMLEFENAIVSPAELYAVYTNAVLTEIAVQEMKTPSAGKTLKIRTKEPLEYTPQTWAQVFNCITDVGVEPKVVSCNFDKLAILYRRMGRKYTKKLCAEKRIRYDEAQDNLVALGIRLHWLPTHR